MPQVHVQVDHAQRLPRKHVGQDVFKVIVVQIEFFQVQEIVECLLANGEQMVVAEIERLQRREIVGEVPVEHANGIVR